ncbi:hypothetical protein OG884_07985 [Streptosporangium sp. NBC_01755]|nr:MULTISPECIES: hypothetical protein [unclassified Streptosporangium]WSA26727.1 hypothetical protein OIE13_02170 [Streptosporangium sp. NBC_01810]WSD01848.1 hypothetical protein OG884_07985 [Streptosporangium sp. NBC_01755]
MARPWPVSCSDGTARSWPGWPRCVLAHDYAVYVEPNVWVRHPLD